MKDNNLAYLSAVANSGTKLSQVIDAQMIFSGSIQASFSDNTAAGTLVLQGSNDPVAGLTVNSSGLPQPINWDTVRNGAVTGSASVSSGALTTISMQWLNYRWLRISWTQSGGAGTVTVNGNFQGN